MPNEKFLIVIDAGHGGHDAGATFKDVREKDIVRKIALQVVDANHDPDVELTVIGEEDKFIDLDARIKAVNSLKPSVLVSLHVNSSSDVSRHGAEVYISPKNGFYDKSKAIANNMMALFGSDAAKIVEKDFYEMPNAPR